MNLPDEPDDLTHESLHALMIVSDLFDRHVTQSAAIKRDPDFAAQAEAVAERLGNLYQALGNRS